MYFILDYENVNYNGLEGTEYLEEGDTVSIFYGPKTNQILTYRVKDIENARCNFEICKLKNVGKNGLDFYIASKVGEIYATDREAKVAIISADKGFQAVLDYWRPRLEHFNQFVKAKSIAKAILGIYGEDVRKKIVNANMSTIDLQNVYAKYKERNRIIKEITDAFEGTDYERFIEPIVDMVLSSERPKILYINSLKSFGKKNGVEVYRRIKMCNLGGQTRAGCGSGM